MSAHRNLRCASTTDGRPVKANAAGGYTVMGGYPGMGFTVVLLLISHDVCMSALPAKPLCSLLLLLCIEVSKRNLLLCREKMIGVWKL
jgi:hypothetical protein